MIRTTTRTTAASVLAATLITLLGTAGAQNHRTHRRGGCAEGEHLSGTHCCNPGEAWVEERNACVCLDPAGCQAPAPAADAGTAAPPAPASTCPEGMVAISGGTFVMGSPTGEGDADEQPQHRVTLSPYCIDRTEVTVSRYRACMQAGGCSMHDTVSMAGMAPADVASWSRYCNGTHADRDEHPINCVDWTQAESFCRWRGGALPTEAEWEFAARGTEGRRYPWGSTPPAPNLLNACGSECASMDERPGRPRRPTMFDGTDGHEATAPVGAFPAGASPFGLMDMAGNVWEWVVDWYGPYAPGAAIDPTGPAAGAQRAVRSSSWLAGNPDLARTTERFPAAPANRLATLGFRCVQRTPVGPAADAGVETAPADAGVPPGLSPGGRRRH